MNFWTIFLYPSSHCQRFHKYCLFPCSGSLYGLTHGPWLGPFFPGSYSYRLDNREITHWMSAVRFLRTRRYLSQISILPSCGYLRQTIASHTKQYLPTRPPRYPSVVIVSSCFCHCHCSQSPPCLALLNNVSGSHCPRNNRHFRIWNSELFTYLGWIYVMVSPTRPSRSCWTFQSISSTNIFLDQLLSPPIHQPLDPTNNLVHHHTIVTIIISYIRMYVKGWSQIANTLSYGHDGCKENCFSIACVLLGKGCQEQLISCEMVTANYWPI